MRVLLVTEHRTPPGLGGGGAESLLRDQTEGLRRLGHSVAWLQSGQIEQAVEQFRPDVVQINTIHNFIGMAPVLWLQEQRIPHVWAIMDYWPFCKPRMLLVDCDAPCSAVEGVCANECGGKRTDLLEVVNRSPVVALNEYSAAIYRRNGMRVDHVVELGVDTDLFAPDPERRDSDPTIYTSSAWAPYPAKGMKYLQQALAGSHYNAHLLSGLPREQVAEGLKQAHIYVFPSVYQETWGLCLNEAMASGCACIASDVAGARAQIQHGVTGLVVPPRDPMALRDAIDSLVTDTAQRRRLGDAARAHVQTDHTLESMGRRWEAVYRQVTGNEHGRQQDDSMV